MYRHDGHQLYQPQDVRLCSVCRNWVELSEFRRRSGGCIASECRECHNSIRATQRRRKRAKKTAQSLHKAISDVNTAKSPSYDLHAAATAILGVCGGLRGFAKAFETQCNQAKPGSQMRTSMLIAGLRLISSMHDSRDNCTH